MGGCRQRTQPQPLSGLTKNVEDFGGHPVATISLYFRRSAGRKDQWADMLGGPTGPGQKTLPDAWDGGVFGSRQGFRGSKRPRGQRAQSPWGRRVTRCQLESRVRGLGGPNIVHSGYCNKIPGWVPCKQTFLSPSPGGWNSEIQMPACSDEDLLQVADVVRKRVSFFSFFF